MKNFFKKTSARVITAISAAILLLWGIAALQMRTCLARIRFDGFGESISVTLTREETQTVRQLLSERERSPGDSCGYSRKICINIGINRFYPATDGCTGLYHNFVHYDLPRESMDALHDIFTKYDIEWWKN